MPNLGPGAFQPSQKELSKMQVDIAREMHARMIALVTSSDGSILDRSVEIKYDYGAADLGGGFTAARVEWSPGLTSLVTAVGGDGEARSDPFKHFTLTEKGDFFPHRAYQEQGYADNILLLNLGRDTLSMLEAAAARV